MENTSLENYLETLESGLKHLQPTEREAQLREVRGHLETLVAGRVAQGQTPDEAAHGAIRQFGAPERLGRDLNRIALRKRMRSSALWIGEAFLTWSFLFGVVLLSYLLIPPNPPISLYDKVWTSLIVATPSFFAGRISAEVTVKAARKWKARRAAK